MPDLGQVLKESRNEAGLSQSDVAESIHVSRQSISKWENNTQMPDISRVRDMAHLYGLTIDGLMEKMEESAAKHKTENDGKANPANEPVHKLMDDLKAEYVTVKQKTNWDDSTLLLILLVVGACIPIVDLITPWLILWKNKKTNRYYWVINIACLLMWCVTLGTYAITYVMSERYM